MANSILFISYSHVDRKWLDRIKRHLDVKLKFQPIETSAWDDCAIQPGQQWFQQIDEALRAARAALLLVSADFLNSDFIMREEWPRLRKAVDEGTVKLLWVALRPSVVNSTDIGNYQSLDGKTRPLSLFDDEECEAEIVRICDSICKQLETVPVTSHGNETLTPLRMNAAPGDSQIGLITDEAGLWGISPGLASSYSTQVNREVGRKLLPRIRWKQHLPRTWHKQIVLSDWNGSLHEWHCRGFLLGPAQR